jgi:hypothetical protein
VIELLGVEPHVLGVGDLEDGGAADLLSELGRRTGRTTYDHCYTDPPWNAGIGRMFRKWADPSGAQGLDRAVDVDRLLDDTVQLCATQVLGWSFVQIGKQKLDVLTAAVQSRPELTLRATIDCTHVNDGGSVVQGGAYLLAFHRVDAPAELVEGEVPVVDPGASWLQLCTDVLGQVAQPGQTVVDWYQGQGMTLRCCEGLGLVSYGLEINAKRAHEAVRRLGADVRTGVVKGM